MTDAQFHELVAVAGLANETNRLANGYRIVVDPQFKPNVCARALITRKSPCLASCVT